MSPLVQFSHRKVSYSRVSDLYECMEETPIKGTAQNVSVFYETIKYDDMDKTQSSSRMYGQIDPSYDTVTFVNGTANSNNNSGAQYEESVVLGQPITDYYANDHGHQSANNTNTDYYA